MKMTTFMAATMASAINYAGSINQAYTLFKVGRKKKKTKAEQLQALRILMDENEERRYRLLAWQDKSFKARDAALDCLPLQVKVLSPAAKRNVKAGILGKKGGLKV